MDSRRKEFVEKTLKQLNNAFGINNEKVTDFRELKMLLYMQMISFGFDDREPIKKSDEDMLRIAKKCYREEKELDPNLSVGKVLKYSPRVLKKFSELIQNNSQEDKLKLQKEFTKYVLTETRNSICHGDFFVNDRDIVEIDSNNPINPFKINYYFDCLIDVCKELIDKKEIEYYKKVLDYLENQDKTTKIGFDDLQNKLIYLDLVTSLLVGYNEAEVYNDNNNYINAVNNLYGMNLSKDIVRHIRNSVIHHYRTISVNDDNKIRILDYKDKNRNKLSEDIEIDFNKLVRFTSKLSINDVLKESSRIKAFPEGEEY